MFLLQVAFVTMFAFRMAMKRLLETQLGKTFPVDMPEKCSALLLHLSTGEHDGHILKWARLGLPQPVAPGTEDVQANARKKPRTRATFKWEQCCLEDSEEVKRLCKAWKELFKDHLAKVKNYLELSHT